MTPQHVAIIMDGNGRWAKKRALPRVAGHRKGVDTVKKLLPICGRRGVPYLTLFAFSSENWNRPATEVRLLIELLTSTLEGEMRRMHENDICLRVIGDLQRFPQKLQKKIAEAEQLTKNNQSLNLTVAINYGGRWDVAQATRKIAERAAAGDIRAQDIDENTINQWLVTKDLPEPDLFIRTGGDTRISNFLLWQLAYTELVFTDVFWPDFDETAFDAALAQFASRQRRFGKTGEQIEADTG